MNKGNQNGQVAIFFAVGFIFIAVLLAMIVNSSVRVAQKMKLQRTLDMAVKVAAQVQRANLNSIIKENNEIIKKFTYTEWLVLNPLIYMAGGCGPAALSKPCGVCNGCSGKDNNRRRKIFNAYEGLRSAYAQSIKNRIEKTNSEAYKQAKNMLLKKHYIPADLRIAIEKNFGGSYPDSERLLAIYETQKFDFDGKGKLETLKERYDLSNFSENFPLFKGKADIKLPMSYLTFKYVCAPLDPSCKVTPGGKPSLRMFYTIDKTSDSFDTFFTAKLTYKPIHSLNIFSIKRMTKYRKGEQLFEEVDDGIVAESMAKPVGGDINSKNNYDDVSLIGIADYNKIRFDLEKQGVPTKYYLH